MKKIIFVMLALVALSSCEKEYVDPDQKPRPMPTNSERPGEIPLHKDQIR